MDEIWKPIPGYEGYYEASSCGRIRSVERYTRNRWGGYTHRKAQLMKCRIVANGYAHVKLTKNGQSAEPLVHRLIADSFLPNPTDLPQVNHIDGNKTNNAVSNLEWCTGSDNQLHNRRILKRICGKKHKPVICLETGICYETAHHAARDMGAKSCWHLLCMRRQKQAYSWTSFLIYLAIDWGVMLYGRQN